MTPEEKTALLLVLSDAKDFCEEWEYMTDRERRDEFYKLTERLNEAIAIVNMI